MIIGNTDRARSDNLLFIFFGLFLLIGSRPILPRSTIFLLLNLASGRRNRSILLLRVLLTTSKVFEFSWLQFFLPQLQLSPNKKTTLELIKTDGFQHTQVAGTQKRKATLTAKNKASLQSGKEGLQRRAAGRGEEPPRLPRAPHENTTMRLRKRTSRRSH